MAITTKVICEYCEFNIVVQGETSPQMAIDSLNLHLSENIDHSIVQKQVWTDDPYIPPTE